MNGFRPTQSTLPGASPGSAAFTTVSALGLAPWVWFALIVLLIALHARMRMVALSGLTLMVCLAAVHVVDSDRLADSVLWSPYNQLRVRTVGADGADGFTIDVNNQFLLSGLDLRPVGERETESTLEETIGPLRTYYDFPFQLAAPDRVLVLGAGAGNDVAAGLRAGVEHITAVEIDPRVAAFGAANHPEHPLASDQVDVVIDDARSFLRSTDETYDLVLFATLDAHGLISSSTSVRLDSFVYTVESLTEAVSLLNEDGVLVVSFGPFREEVQLRQYAMMEQVLGSPPDYFIHSNNHRMLVGGANAEQLAVLPPGWTRIDPQTVVEGFSKHPQSLLPATDDWPHLYVREPGIPIEYVVTLVGMALVGLMMVRRQIRSIRRADLPFFFLGAAFLLMETKSVIEFALLIGSTWQTNALVFSVILAIILVANLVVHRSRSGDTRIWLLVIGLSLAAHFFWPVSVWPEFGSMKLLAAAVYLGVPIYAAAIVFARWFSASRVGSVALGVNLLGAVIGGALEYSSLLIGIRALAILALAVYGLAYLTYVLSERSSVSLSAP